MTEVRDNADRQRYEVTVDGELAGFVVYEDRGGARALVHTETFPAFAGRGVGGALARAALDDIRARDLTVVAQCPFIASWIAKHDDYADLVAR